MPTAFTEEESARIRTELILACMRLSKELGLQKMSVEKLTEAVGIAKGSFYLFFAQKRNLSSKPQNMQAEKRRKCSSQS